MAELTATVEQANITIVVHLSVSGCVSACYMGGLGQGRKQGSSYEVAAVQHVHQPTSSHGVLLSVTAFSPSLEKCIMSRRNS